jgi:hypothetical protein
MEGTLVLIAITLTVITTATAIVTAASIVITITITAVTVAVAVVSTVAGVVSVVVVGRREARSKSGSNLHEVDEFLSSCCSWKLLGILDECCLIVRTLATEEGLLNVVLSWKDVRTRHHGGVLDEDVESNEELTGRHGRWDVSTTGTDVLDERGSIGVGADRGRDCCFDRVVLGLIDWTGCWQTIGLLEVDKEFDWRWKLRSSISVGRTSVGWSSINLTSSKTIEGSSAAKWLLSTSTVTVERHGWSRNVDRSTWQVGVACR